MRSVARETVAPVYLLMCLLLGGSAQGVWTNMFLQLVGVAIIAWAAIAPAEEPLTGPARQLLWIFMAGLAVVALQLLPLPASLWPHLGGREELAAGYTVLGLPTPALPLSLAPHASVATLLTLIPPLALFCAIVRLKAYRPNWLALALLAGTLAGVVLGALQVASADPPSSPWYLYRSSSFWAAVGFFANANHMGILLVITLPFLGAFLASAQGANVQRYSAAVALIAGAALVILVGITLNGSLAAYGLAVPVLAVTTLLVIPARSAVRGWVTLCAVVLLAGAVAALAFSPIGERNLSTTTSIESRSAIMATTAEAIGDFLPFGSGLGTFRPVFQLYEDHDPVGRVYINHAHNDYAELTLETGLTGILVMALFFAWWGAAAWRVWRTAAAGPFARAASIASAAILIHSAVDFPLRTAAISASFAMCLALLVERPAPRRSDQSDLWPTRHVVLK